MTIFSDWLTNQLANRRISPAELSRLTKKDQGVVSRLLSGEHKPANKTLNAIARALNLPLEEVYQAAGVLPPNPSNDPWIDEQLHLLRQIPPNMRATAARVIESFANADEVERESQAAKGNQLERKKAIKQ
jgi:transcriptional regulator with XRE-family HTH domain